MKNIELKLEIEGKEKVFCCTKVKGILLRKTAEISKTFSKMNDNFSDEVLDELVDYVVEVFNNQFTREQYYEGVELEDTVLNINNIASEIMDMASSKIKNS